MADNTAIEWTHRAGTKGETWNPIVGCSIHSPGCTNCYAMTMAARIEAIDAAAGRASHYAGTTKKVKGRPVWTGKIGVAPDHIFTAPLRWRSPRTVFVNSMSDLFHDDVPDAVIDRVFAVMALAPQHTFQVLTKRAKRMRDYLTLGGPTLQQMAQVPQVGRDVMVANTDWPLPNVWLGVSAERRTEWLERTADLRETPAAIRFVSAEPLLGDLGEIDLAGLHWIIVGGESGDGARPMHPAWARSIRDQCAAAGTAFFFKQWGEHLGGEGEDCGDAVWFEAASEKRDDRWLKTSDEFDWFDPSLAPDGPMHIRLGKKRAGRVLDGVEHNGFPQIREVPFG